MMAAGAGGGTGTNPGRRRMTPAARVTQGARSNGGERQDRRQPPQVPGGERVQQESLEIALIKGVPGQGLGRSGWRVEHHGGRWVRARAEDTGGGGKSSSHSSPASSLASSIFNLPASVTATDAGVGSGSGAVEDDETGCSASRRGPKSVFVNSRGSR